MRREFFVSLTILVIGSGFAWFYAPVWLWAWTVLGPLAGIGLLDAFQKKQAVRRNFPIIGNFRYLLEMIRPEINQYFIESNSSGTPFSRELRSVVYQRSKKQLDTLPFGTQKDVYSAGYEWIKHSMLPVPVDPEGLRFTIGGPDCQQPYSASLLNISAMSFGALSGNAIRALNLGAKQGGFAHNTGEGSVSPYHEQGGDLIWQIGTGYFGCRTGDGRFDDEKFAAKMKMPEIKMVEIKISQGAKPGHGGILPAHKVTEEISKIRGVPMGEDVLSPPAHKEFATPRELVHFIARLRTLAEGKPVGIKFCLGQRRDFLGLCKAMVAENIVPDYIAVDGGEGGTGAAPLEFSNYIGTPGLEALHFVHRALVGFDLRKHVRIIFAGKVITGFQIIKALALGADGVYSARAMMMALGCIQALRCNANVCPVGVATQDKWLERGLVVGHKAERVYHFHRETVGAVAHMLGAMGCAGAGQVKPWHIVRRVSPIKVEHYGNIFKSIETGSLLAEPYPSSFAGAMANSDPDTF